MPRWCVADFLRQNFRSVKERLPVTKSSAPLLEKCKAPIKFYSMVEEDESPGEVPGTLDMITL